MHTEFTAVRDTNYETYQGSNQNYLIAGQVTPIDSYMDDGGYEVVHQDFTLQDKQTQTRADKIYTLSDSVTMSYSATTSSVSSWILNSSCPSLGERSNTC